MPLYCLILSLKLQQDNVKYSNLQALQESDPTSKRLSRPKKSPIRKFSPMSVQPRNTFSEDWWLVYQMFVQENSEQNSFHLWRPPWSWWCYWRRLFWWWWWWRWLDDDDDDDDDVLPRRPPPSPSPLSPLLTGSSQATSYLVSADSLFKTRQVKSEMEVSRWNCVLNPNCL